MRLYLLVGILAFSWASSSAFADPKMVRYGGQHPIPKKMGGGFCYIDFPHLHPIGPTDPRMYRMHDDEYVFVGDPAPFGYEGPKYTYYGPHPLVDVDVGSPDPVYCYLEGPHFHFVAPPPSARFELKGGTYWYTGDFAPSFAQDRPRYMAINDAYRPLEYERPVVDVHVAPPSFHVSVDVPPPPVVGVHVGLFGGPPPPVVYTREYEDEHHREWREHEWKEHHDNGRHEGWFKEGHGEGHGGKHGWK
jgi:hypothetical protein